MKIVVGITGGIAAYKVPELVRLLKKAGHEVRCAATEHALEFVTRVTLETVSGAPLYSDLFASGRTEHISLKDWGEMLVVAPATANIIGKVASIWWDPRTASLPAASAAWAAWPNPKPSPSVSDYYHNPQSHWQDNAG